MAFVTLVREEAVIAGRDGQADQQVRDEKQDRLPPLHAELEGVGGSAEDPDDRGQRQKKDIRPVFFSLFHELVRSLQKG